MASTIKNFLIGIGLDSSEFDAGSKKVISGMNGIRSKSLGLAGALVTGGAAVAGLSFNFAQSADELGKFSSVYGEIPDDIRAMGNALAQEGGSLESFMGQIANIEKLRSMKGSDIGALFGAAGVHGVDASIITDAESATDAYLNLSDVMEDMSGKERIAVANVFGLDDSSIRLLSQGRDEVSAIIEEQRAIRGMTVEMTQAAREFNQEWLDVKSNIGAASDKLASKTMPMLTELFKVFNSGDLGDAVTSGFSRGSSSLEVGAVSPSVYSPSNKTLGSRSENKTSVDFIKALFGRDAPEDVTGKAESSRKAESEKMTSSATRTSQSSSSKPVEVTLKLDSKVLESVVVDINEKGFSETLENLTSTTKG